jgi:hypothetical protein
MMSDVAVILLTQRKRVTWRINHAKVLVRQISSMEVIQDLSDTH